MSSAMQNAVLFGAALMLAPITASAAGFLTAPNGMTLYYFDKDIRGNTANNNKGVQSECYDKCAEMWPPFLAEDGQKMGPGWAKMGRHNGPVQWVFDGRPVYFYSGDTKPGQSSGDGRDGAWHMIPVN